MNRTTRQASGYPTLSLNSSYYTINDIPRSIVNMRNFRISVTVFFYRFLQERKTGRKQGCFLPDEIPELTKKSCVDVGHFAAGDDVGAVGVVAGARHAVQK